MDYNLEEIFRKIPQRPPFLFVDKILETFENKIIVQRTIREDEYFFEGHFPDNPIMPGVLLCEATFQAGALLVGNIVLSSKPLAVVSRIQNAKFKEIVRPNDVLKIEVTLLENLENAYFFKGNIKTNNKTVLQIEFSCAVIS